MVLKFELNGRWGLHSFYTNLVDDVFVCYLLTQIPKTPKGYDHNCISTEANQRDGDVDPLHDVPCSDICCSVIEGVATCNVSYPRPDICCVHGGAI